MKVVCILVLENGPLAQLAEACLRFSSQIALGERAIFIEIGRSHRLYTPETLLLRVKSLARRFGLKVRVTLGEDIPTALALAIFDMQRKEDLPIEALQIYTNPFRRTDSLASAIATFRRLGVTSLKEFTDLPIKSLAARFGKEGLLVRHHVDSVLSLPWPRFEPVEKINESLDLDESYSVREIEPLMFVLKGLADRALLRARGRGEMALAVRIQAVQEKYTYVSTPLREWDVEFALPQGSSVSVLPILREHLERDLTTKPLMSPLRTLNFIIVKTAPGQAQQKDFFCKKEEEQESFRSIVARLTERLGPNHAFMASPIESYLPEYSWKKTLTHVSKVELKVAERPLRVLKHPQNVRRMDNYLIHRHKKWHIDEIIGPEKLSNQWWNDGKSDSEQDERNYYRIKTSSGEELWVYSTAKSADYFLHGIFD